MSEKSKDGWKTFKLTDGYVKMRPIGQLFEIEGEYSVIFVPLPRRFWPMDFPETEE
jgi:hypothetical protein